MFSSWVWVEARSAWWRNQKYQFPGSEAKKKQAKCEKTLRPTLLSFSITVTNVASSSAEWNLWGREWRLWAAQRPLQKGPARKMCVVTASHTWFNGPYQPIGNILQRPNLFVTRRERLRSWCLTAVRPGVSHNVILLLVWIQQKRFVSRLKCVKRNYTGGFCVFYSEGVLRGDLTAK